MTLAFLITQEMWVQILQLLVAVATILKVYVVNKKVTETDKKVSDTSKQVTETKDELNIVKKEINGHMEKLLESREAVGNLKGREDLKNEIKSEANIQTKLIESNTQLIIDELKRTTTETVKTEESAKSAEMLIMVAQTAAEKLIAAAKEAAEKLAAEPQKVKIVQGEGDAVMVKQETPIPVAVVEDPKGKLGQ